MLFIPMLWQGEKHDFNLACIYSVLLAKYLGVEQ